MEIPPSTIVWKPVLVLHNSNLTTTNMSENQLVLITGASGYIAAWIVKDFLENGYRVRGTVRDPLAEKVKFLKELPGASERLELVSLDLLKSSAEQYQEVLQGVTLVAHTASPFPPSSPKHEDELIKPAVEGTLGVLRAAAKTPTVKVVVVTSSVAAIGHTGVKTEADWNDPNKADTYPKSKTLAERAAWAFYEEQKPTWALCTINPALVQGPSLSNEISTSSYITARLMNKDMPLLPKYMFNIVDVRDVALAHYKALTLNPDIVNGKRFIVSNKPMWLVEMATALSNTFSKMGYSFATIQAPYFLIWLVSFVDKDARTILPNLDVSTIFVNDLSKQVLQLEYTDINKTFADHGHSLIYYGIVKKTPDYKPPFEGWTPLASAKN